MKRELDYKKIILTTIGTAGILAVSIVAPNALKLFSSILNKKKISKGHLNAKTKKLINDGFLKIENKNKKNLITLTPKGERVLNLYKAKDQSKVSRKNKWDGKWRVVIFDVWENARAKRDLLRKEIREYGFIQLQASVWIYPFDCGDYIELLKTDLSFGKNIRYMVVEYLDHDTELKKFFKLI